MSTSLRGYLPVMAAAALWGIAGATAKYLFSQQAVPPFLLVQIRMGLASLLLLGTLALIAPHLLRVERRDIGFLAIWGIGGMAGVQFTYLMTISETNVATAIFLQSLAPILTALYAKVFGGQRLGALLVGCLAVALTGLFLLIMGGSDGLLVSPLGLLSGLGSAAFLSFYAIYGARGMDRLSPWTLLGYGLGAGFLFWLVVDGVLWAIGRPLAGLSLLASPTLWLYFFYIASFATVVPFGLFLSGLRYLSPTQATITNMLEPVVGGFAAYFALGEALRPTQVLGGVLIVAAVIYLQSRSGTATEKPTS